MYIININFNIIKMRQSEKKWRRGSAVRRGIVKGVFFHSITQMQKKKDEKRQEGLEERKGCDSHYRMVGGEIRLKVE